MSLHSATVNIHFLFLFTTIFIFITAIRFREKIKIFFYKIFSILMLIEIPIPPIYNPRKSISSQTSLRLMPANSLDY